MMDTAPTFEQHRSHLKGLAYRMLGSVSEAEDIVQDAYLRWHQTDTTAVDNPRAFLSKVVSRLCLDRWKDASRKREQYVGPWLPEPLVTDDAASTCELEREVSYALMLALERLSPLERAAFLLHDVFGLPFDEVATALDRSAPACRQLATRARQNVQADRPRFEVGASDSRRVAEAFFTAARQGDTTALRDLLVADATFHSDGGGVRSAALRVITGVDKLCRLFAALARKAEGSGPLWARPMVINGLPGFLTVEQDGQLQTTALDIVDGRIANIYIVRNPHKLTHLAERVPPNLRP